MDELLGRKHGKGYIQSTSVDNSAFDEQYHSFQRSGYVVDLESQKIIGNHENYEKEVRNERASYETNKTEAKKNKRKFKDILVNEDVDDEDAGPWASFKEEKPVITLPQAPPVLPPSASSSSGVAQSISVKPAMAVRDVDQPLPPNTYIIEPDDEEEKWERKAEKKLSFMLPHRPTRGSLPMEARSEFHGDAEVDFQGRSWVLPPQGIHPIDDYEHFSCYIPKKCVSRISAHSKGVQTIEYFPNYGHLLLSASMDGTCKIWDSSGSGANNTRLLRTYTGHAEGIRSMKMSNDGKHFLTSSFDRYIRHWDVETGQCTGTFTNRKMGFQVKYYPRDNNIFLSPASDNKIYQWDMRSGEICQVYNYHLAPVSTVTFYDDGKKFISTSDDKKVLVWEYDIPVPIKYIQDAEMHSIPSMTHHPIEPFVVGQSMDNKIVVYSAGDNVKQIRKRAFRGHNSSGYACQIGFSLNGQFMMSGDGLGQLVFWDWASQKIYRKLQAHDGGPCMAALWHPLHANRVATCGWDGFIKIWE